MAVITYGTDVAPHLRRQLTYRRLRMQRAQVLYESRPDPYDDYHPYTGLETASSVDLLIGLICSLGSSLAFIGIGDWAKFGPLKLLGLSAAKL